MFKNKHPLPTNPLHDKALYLLFISVAIAGTAHLWNLPLWITGLFLCAIGTKSLLIKKKKAFDSRLIPILLAVPAVLLIYYQYSTLLGLDASISLLVIMLGLKVLEMKEYRDAMLIIFLGFFVVATVFIFRQSLVILPYLLLSVFLLSLSMHLINDFSGKQSFKNQLRVNSAMLFSSIPLILILFVFFPRLDSPLWKLPGSGQAKTGMSDDMSPGQISKLARSSEPAFRVNFIANRLEQSELYWRGPVLTNFDGRRWTRTDHTQLSEPVTQFSEPAKEIFSTNETTHYEVTVEPHYNNWVFALSTPTSIPANTQFNKDYELLSETPISKPTLFKITSSPAPLLANEWSSEQVQSSLRLPAGVSPRTRQLAQRLFQSAEGNEVKFVGSVLNHFNREPFHYTLEPAPLSSDYIDSFMFDTKEGFCEHYASSFVVMMRSVGIPARVVTGYQGGSWNSEKNYLLVRQSDAHAWSEVWFENRGWVRYDPTGMVAPERVNQGIGEALGNSSLLPMSLRFTFMKKLSMQWDGLNYQWNKWVASYDNTFRSELLQKLKIGAGSWGKVIIGVLLLIAVLVLFWIGLYQLYSWWVKPKNKLLNLYLKFSRHVEKQSGLKPLPGETELAFAKRIAIQQPTIGKPVKQFTLTFIKARYSGNQHDLSLLEKQLTAIQVGNE